MQALSLEDISLEDSDTSPSDTAAPSGEHHNPLVLPTPSILGEWTATLLRTMQTLQDP
jgi:hypothetical protein